MLTIWKRELQSFFHTPIGYVFVGIFLALSGLMFYLNNLQTLTGELLIFLSQLTLLIMLLSPLLTMRLLCEDRQKRTDQLLLTCPVTLPQIVLGKYLAAATVMLAAVFLTNVFTLVVALYGKVFAGEWFVGYLGFSLQCLAFLALDMLVTCFAKNQITAAIAAFSANFLFWMADLLTDYLPQGLPRDALGFLSLYKRYEPFILGQLSFASIVYFVSFIAVCLVATVHIMDGRRFSRGGAA